MYLKLKITILLLLLIVIRQPGVYSQEAVVGLDTSQIRIGEQTLFRIRVTYPAGAIPLGWPVAPDTLTSGVEIVGGMIPDSVIDSQSNALSLSANILITAFDSGYYIIKPLVFKYRLEGDTAVYAFESNALLLDVQYPEVDLAGEIKDIKDIQPAPLTFRDILPYILLTVIVLVAALILKYYLKRRKSNDPIRLIPKRPALPPHLVALDALELLKGRKLWQQGLVKEYYTELTEIVRKYIEERFLVPSLEMTTDETMDALISHVPGQEQIEDLRYLLTLADFVKFAKAHPLPQEHDLGYQKAVAFVRATMKVSGGDLSRPKEDDEKTSGNDNDQSAN